MESHPCLAGVAVEDVLEAVEQLAVGSDAVVEVVPGRDHGTLLPPLRERIAREMAEQFRRGYRP